MTIVGDSAMKTMPAGQFKTHCLAVIDEVNAKHETVVITKHGKPMAKLIPVQQEDDEIFDSMKDRIKILGDLVEPAIPLEEWERLR
jgi:prevent-host-death family protein